MVTVDKDLLFACSFFDLGHSGYFEAKDLVNIHYQSNRGRIVSACLVCDYVIGVETVSIMTFSIMALSITRDKMRHTAQWLSVVFSECHVC
jgi:hypothetical protein